MVTPEALNERKAALEGDPGTDSSTKVTIPAEHSPLPVKEPLQKPQLASEVSMATLYFLRWHRTTLQWHYVEPQ